AKRDQAIGTNATHRSLESRKATPGCRHTYGTPCIRTYRAGCKSRCHGDTRAAARPTRGTRQLWIPGVPGRSHEFVGPPSSSRGKGNHIVLSEGNHSPSNDIAHHSGCPSCFAVPPSKVAGCYSKIPY